MTTRLATMDDLPFIDALQKRYSKQLGFFPRAQIEGYIRNGWMRIATDEAGRAIGYCASRDRYQKRDELGAIFQLCVDDSVQRKLVGATLLKSVFENSAYGTRLYCCWCAQDIAGNRFWEAMGFVPLAFRAGSREKSRVHIFWQKRIRSGDTTTPWWFPSQTAGGAIREDRIVLPIPPGTHWSDAKPLVLPGDQLSVDGGLLSEQSAEKQKKLPSPRKRATSVLPATADCPPPTQVKRARLGGGALRFATADVARTDEPKVTKRAKVERAAKEKAKNDPRLIAAARELRDRWLEEASVNPQLIAPGDAKYDVARQPQFAANETAALTHRDVLTQPDALTQRATLLLPAA